MRYSTRNDAFKPPTIWVLDGATLWLEPENGPLRTIPFAQVRSLRLDFAPTRPERNRFRCQLMLSSGETFTCFNRTYAGVYDFRDTSAEYVAFVRALAAALAQHAPGCQFLTGATGASYAFNLAIAGFIFLLLVWALFVAGNMGMLVLIALFFVFYLPTLIRWVKRNRPQTFHPSAIPANVIPAAAPESSGRPASA